MEYCLIHTIFFEAEIKILGIYYWLAVLSICCSLATVYLSQFGELVEITLPEKYEIATTLHTGDETSLVNFNIFYW